MSLQVWLPLDGNLANNGLYDSSVVGSTAAVNNYGKLSKCYSFTGSDSGISATFKFSSAITFCCWVFLESNSNFHILDARISESSGY